MPLEACEGVGDILRIGVLQRFVFGNSNVGNSEPIRNIAEWMLRVVYNYPVVCRGSCSLTHTLRVMLYWREHEFCLFIGKVSYDLSYGRAE